MRRLRSAFRVPQHPLGGGHTPARAVEDLEAILEHQAGHVAPEATPTVWTRRAALAAVRANMIPTSWRAAPRPRLKKPETPVMSFGFSARARSPMSVKVHGHAGLQVLADGLKSGASARTLPGST